MVSEKKQASNKRYDDKTYKHIMFKLRYDSDADLIEEIQALTSNGGSKREWLRDLKNGGTGYSKEQIVKAFDGFKGVLTPRMIEQMLDDIKE